MAAAALWGLLASSSLLVGAVVGLRVRLSEGVHGLLLAFGAGALISAVGVELAAEGLEEGSIGALAGGLVGRSFDGTVLPIAAGFAVCSVITCAIVIIAEGREDLFGRNRVT
jgi:hypothetical protein